MQHASGTLVNMCMCDTPSIHVKVAVVSLVLLLLASYFEFKVIDGQHLNNNYCMCSPLNYNSKGCLSVSC